MWTISQDDEHDVINPKANYLVASFVLKEDAVLACVAVNSDQNKLDTLNEINRLASIPVDDNNAMPDDIADPLWLLYKIRELSANALEASGL